MKDFHVHTYQEAVHVIKEIGLLPLAPLIPEFPALNTITSKESWHTDTLYDPWLWRTKFSTEGVAAYGKFFKKKAVFISNELLPLVIAVRGNQEEINERYLKGKVSKEAVNLYTLIRREEGIDTRELRTKAGMKDKEKKKEFDRALLELQETMDIVISGIKEKQNAMGEKNGWSSTAYETMDNWMNNHQIERLNLSREEVKEKLIQHFSRICSDEALKKIDKILM